MALVLAEAKLLDVTVTGFTVFPAAEPVTETVYEHDAPDTSESPETEMDVEVTFMISKHTHVLFSSFYQSQKSYSRTQPAAQFLVMRLDRMEVYRPMKRRKQSQQY